MKPHLMMFAAALCLVDALLERNCQELILIFHCMKVSEVGNLQLNIVQNQVYGKERASCFAKFVFPVSRDG